MSETITTEQWLQNRLESDSTLSGLINKVYGYVAPTDAVYPFVIYQYEDGMDDQGIGSTRILSSLDYTVKVIGEVEGFLALEAAANRIDALLHGASGTVSDGGEIVSSVRIKPVSYVEAAEGGGQYRHLGGIYRLQVRD